MKKYYSELTLKTDLEKQIQCDWDEFFVASVIAASKENLYQSPITINASFLF